MRTLRTTCQLNRGGSGTLSCPLRDEPEANGAFPLLASVPSTVKPGLLELSELMLSFSGRSAVSRDLPSSYCSRKAKAVKIEIKGDSFSRS
jgi:hypothetical protein